MSSENTRCIEDTECEPGLICLSGICKKPNSDLGKLSNFQREHLDELDNADKKKIEKELLKARRDEINKMKPHEKNLIKQTIDEEKNENVECPICTEQLYPFQRTIFCDRYHPLHEQCFMQMYQSNHERVRCPICRIPYSEYVMQYARANDPNVTIRRQQIIDQDNLSQHSDSVYSNSDDETITSEQVENEEMEPIDIQYNDPNTGDIMNTRYYRTIEDMNISRHGNMLSNNENAARNDAIRHDIRFRNRHRVRSDSLDEQDRYLSDDERDQIRDERAAAAARNALASHSLNNFDNVMNTRNGISNYPPNSLYARQQEQLTNTINDALARTRARLQETNAINSERANIRAREAEMAERIRSEGTNARRRRNLPFSRNRSRSPPRGGKKTQKRRTWSKKYKKSINCKKPKGFSQKQYCKYGRKTRKK